MTRKEAIQEINYLATIESVSFETMLKGSLMDFYECAGFWSDKVEEEVNAMTEDQLLDAYIDMRTPISE